MSMVTITEAPPEDQEPPPARQVVDQPAAVPPSSARARRSTASSIGSVRRPVFVFDERSRPVRVRWVLTC